MAKRYELSDAAWERIADLVSPEQKMGRPRSDDRLMLNGLHWILCSGAAWRTCQSGLAHGRRCSNGFVTGGMTVRPTKFLSVCRFD